MDRLLDNEEASRREWRRQWQLLFEGVLYENDQLIKKTR